MFYDEFSDKKKRILKHVFALFFAVGIVGFFHFWHGSPTEYISYIVYAAILWICFGRIFEFILGLPMSGPKTSGGISGWASIARSRVGLRIFMLIIYTAIAAGVVYSFIMFDFTSEDIHP